jgi:hypothetical protein
MTEHDDDLTQWAIEQASALRSGRVSELDLTNLADQMEGLANTEKSAVEGLLGSLLVQLLRHEFHWSRRDNGTRAAVQVARMRLLRKTSARSLSKHMRDELEKGEVYKLARLSAVVLTRLPPTMFPEKCPYTLEQVLDESFIPESGYPLNRSAPLAAGPTHRTSKRAKNPAKQSNPEN